MATVKDLLASIASFTITLASLANSTAGVGRQATLIDNTTNLYTSALISASIKLGTSPSNNAPVFLYLIRSDNNGTPILDDGGGASDAAWTQNNAPLLGVLKSKAAASTGDVLSGVFDTKFLGSLGAKWTIGVVNNTGVNLDSTGGNHVISYTGITQTVA
jgi:hypothetical protein